MSERMTDRTGNCTSSWMRYSREEIRAAWDRDDNEAAHAPHDHVVVEFYCPDEDRALWWSAILCREFLASLKQYHYNPVRSMFRVCLGQAVDYGNGCDDVGQSLTRVVRLLMEDPFHGEGAGLVRRYVPGLFAGEEATDVPPMYPR